MSGLKDAFTPRYPGRYIPGKWGIAVYPKTYIPGKWGFEVNLTPAQPRPPWEKPWTPTPTSQRQADLARLIAARRAQEQAQRQAAQARARAEWEARTRAERERQRQEQYRRLRDEIQRQNAHSQLLREELIRQAAMRAQLQKQRVPQNEMNLQYLNYHRFFGKEWMAKRGHFGLAGTLRPIGKVLGHGLALTFEAGGYLSPVPVAGAGSQLLASKIGQGLHDIRDYEEFLRAQNQPAGTRQIKVTPDAAKTDAAMKTVGTYEVVVAGTLKESLNDKITKEIARLFADRLLEKQLENPKRAMHKISADAHKLVQEVDLPEICRKFGIKTHQVTIEPISGVTGAGGGQVRYDVGIYRRRVALIELKSSAYQTERTALQLQAHQIGVGEKTATYGKRGDYYRIYAKERLIEKWTWEDLVRAFRAQRPGATGKLPKLR